MTLSEVLVVATILGILALMTVFSLKPQLQTSKARDSRRQADLKKISIALEDYLNDNVCYPESLYLDAETCAPAAVFEPYFRQIPCDPRTQKPYSYNRPDNCNEYVLYATLEMETDQVYSLGNYVLTSSNLVAIPTTEPTSGALPPSSVPTSAPAGPAPTIDPTWPFCGCRQGVCIQLSNPPGCQSVYPCSTNCYNQCLDEEGNPQHECN